ncbi:peptidoglycan bridge formation glycyltransferase FemA/FemB family protein, partial [Candidatus Roizmanbacteria bacterium]|nr:peptidoglycan bridge formation glycyltransferase FemA/FemB family protein [Candidatus Roizmanbacteria bacterium]
MISTDFAPNESWDDAWLSFKLLFQPWRWKRGEETEIIKKELIKLFLSSKYHIGDGRTEMVQLFLTGRAALFELLKSLRLSKDYEVIVQAFTCEAVVLPILANNLKPVYVDIEAETFSMNFADLTKKLTNSSKVLILQHTFGLTPKYRERILRLANKHELIVVEDLAHGFNPSVFKTMNYELSTTNYFLLSFGRSKALSSVFGGAIISSNNETMEQWNNLPYPSYFFIFKCLLYKPLTMLIKFTYNFGFGKILHKVLINLNLLIPEITSKEKNGEFDELLNKAYPNGLNILLLHQLKKFDQILKHRVKICAYYSGHIQKTTNHQLSTINSSVIRYPLLVNNRDEILEKLRLQDIFLGKWYDQVVAPKKIDLKRVGYKLGSCPVAEEVCKKIINLPTNISETEAKKVINILNDVMTIQEIVKKSTWQRFFEKNGSPSFLQSWEWGEFEKRMGYKVTRLGIYLKNELVGMAQVIHMKTRRGNFLFIPHGPILTISNFK